MRKNRQGGLQVFHGPLWAAGQVDDEGSSADACDGTGEHGVSCLFQAVRAHGFSKTRRFTLDDCTGGLRGYISLGKTSAACGKDDIELSTVGPGDQRGANSAFTADSYSPIS